MALRSIEPRELIGCACDGYSQLEAMIEARAREVEAVVAPRASLLGSRAALSAARTAIMRSIQVIAIDDSNDEAADESGHDAGDRDDGAGNLPIARARRHPDGAEASWIELSECCANAGARADRMLMIGTQAGDVPLMERAWLSVALPGADAAVLEVADAQAAAGTGDPVACLLEELAADR